PLNPDVGQHGTGIPKVEFALNEGDAFRIGVFTSCGAAGMACGVETGQIAIGRTEWSFRDSACDPSGPSGPGYPSCRTRSTVWPSTVYVRVTRNGGAATLCNRFQLKVSR